MTEHVFYHEHVFGVNTTSPTPTGTRRSPQAPARSRPSCRLRATAPTADRVERAGPFRPAVDCPPSGHLRVRRSMRSHITAGSVRQWTIRISARSSKGETRLPERVLERGLGDERHTRVDEVADDAEEDLHCPVRLGIAVRMRVAVERLDQALFDLVATDGRTRNRASELVRQRRRPGPRRAGDDHEQRLRHRYATISAAPSPSTIREKRGTTSIVFSCEQNSMSASRPGGP